MYTALPSSTLTSTSKLEEPESHPQSAPRNLRYRLITTTLLSSLLFLLIFYTYHTIAIRFDLIHLSLTPSTTSCTVPPLFDIPTVFKQNRDYMSTSHEFDHLWKALLPPNGGFVQPDKKGFERDANSGISMFHQLHCLNMLRNALQDYDLGVTPPQGDRHADNTFDDHPNEHHWSHCLDYLRRVSLGSWRRAVVSGNQG